MQNPIPSRRPDIVTESQTERAARTERTVAASEQQAERTKDTMQRTANTLEAALAEVEGTHDPGVAKKIRDLVNYLRASSEAPNPLLQLLTEPDMQRPPPAGRRPQ